MIKDLVKCTYCGRVQLVKMAADSCPTCAEEGYLSWCDHEIQQIDTDNINIETSIENGWKVIERADGVKFMYYTLVDKVILQDENGKFNLNNCSEDIFLESSWDFAFEKTLSKEEVFCLTFKDH